MNYKELRIIFMGTPDFAVASLEKLISEGCNIVAVVTSPDKPAGRGMQLQESPVKKFAIEHHLNVLQPEKLKDENFVNTIESLKPDLQVVVAFRMLPEIIWSLPPMGTLNLHGSLLPQYRGAAPINWAIINGEKFTGVTTFKLKHEIDTGNILLSEKILINDNETAGTLHDKMKNVGADLLFQTIVGLANNTIVEKPQENKAYKNAPKIFTETCTIDWNQSCTSVHNLIRGLSPYPGAFSYLDGKKIKIFESEIKHGPLLNPGEITTDGKTFLRYSCLDGQINILELQLEGKKRMAIADFLRGYRQN
jgi:methionyl-tRNA formyltransferase